MKKQIILEEIEGNMEIRKVLLRSDGVKYLIVPKNSNFEKDDYVKLTKLKEV